VIIAVMQFEGHVLQPLLLGRAVQVHPLAVVLAIAAGLLLGGIFGALIAVPIVACTNVATAYLMRRTHRQDDPKAPVPGEPEDEDGAPVTSDPSTTGVVSPGNGDRPVRAR